MKLLIIITVFFQFFIFQSTVQSQDIHFSQYYNAPLLINPALTGDLNDCYLRLGFNYKDQWDKTFVTQSAFVDSKIPLKHYRDKNSLGIGVMFYNDKAGDSELTTNYGVALLSLHKSFNPNKTVFGSLGFSFGLGNLSINYSNLYFDSQWNGFTFDNNLSNNENFASNSLLYYNLNVGGMLTFIKPNSYKLKVGGSISNIIGKKYSFLGQNIYKGKKYLVHSDIIFKINKQIILSPSILLSMQNQSSEIIAGGNSCFLFSDIKLLTGLWFRFLRDITPVVGIECHKFSLNLSYDINISKQHVATNYQGGLEFSFIKKICYTNDQLRIKEHFPCEYW